jgi:hypothetical protein
VPALLLTAATLLRLGPAPAPAPSRIPSRP